MLTLIAYRFAVGADLPKVSYLTRLDFFILSATILVFASLIEVIVTSTMATQEKLGLARRLDNWARVLFPAIFIIVAIKTFA
jgi:cadmium resistance protein CadD (predicted permease)